jgi:hypothetical protein
VACRSDRHESGVGRPAIHSGWSSRDLDPDDGVDCGALGTLEAGESPVQIGAETLLGEQGPGLQAVGRVEPIARSLEQVLHVGAPSLSRPPAGAGDPVDGAAALGAGLVSAGDLDLYEVGDLPFTPESIHAVQVTMCARKDDAATREVRSKVKSGATSADGAVHAMAAIYQYFRDIHETDPDTAAASTSGGVNALQIGPEVVT